MYIYELGIFVSMTCNTYKMRFYMFVHTCNMNAPVIFVRICINIDDYICIMYIEDEVCELYIYINAHKAGIDHVLSYLVHILMM